MKYNITVTRSKEHLRINYKSGNFIEVWVDNADTKHKRHAELREFNINGLLDANGLFLGMTDIESIWVIDRHMSLWEWVTGRGVSSLSLFWHVVVLLSGAFIFAIIWS